MAGSIYNYDYDDEGVSIVTQKQQEEEKQEEVDITQDIQIKVNKDVNALQDLRMDDLQRQIDNVSGGTITDLDAGTW